MSNSQITSQLTRVTVPSIGNSNFAEGIRNAFETINNNFKTIASLPFIQGVQGDSYTQISKDIWVEVNNNISSVYYALSKEGAVLLNSIFENVLDDTKKFQEGDSFDECKTSKLSDLSLNGVSPIDSFFTEENGVVKPVNNKLYFYSVINNLNEEQDTYLGQYFYFIDYRITELGKAYHDESLSEFNDFTGFYQYQPASETELEKYNSISIVPNLYYDKDKNDICWKYNGQQTGISAMGPKGIDGKVANFKIVYVQYVNDTDNSGEILGYFDSVKEAIEYTNTLNNCFCLVQFVNTVTNEDNTVTITSYVDSAYGEVYENKVYWQNSLKIGNLFNNQNITKYFCNMGNDPTGIENHPYYFAIPTNLNRTNANEDSYKFGHVFSSSNDGNLVLQKANNAFTEAGGQNPLYDLETEGTQNLFDIKNYDVNIDQNLTVGGTLEVSGTGTFDSDLTVGGTLEVSGTGAFDSDLTVGGTLEVSNEAEFGNSLTVDGGLYAITKKPTSVTDKDSEGPADGLSNVLIGHNDPGNGEGGFGDFPKDLDKGGYPLVIKSLKTDDTVNNGAMVFGMSDIYTLSKTGDGNWSSGTLCLNHRGGYFGDVQIGRNLNIGDNDNGGNVTIYSSSADNGKLTVGNGAVITSNSTNISGLQVSGSSWSTGVTGYGGTGIIVDGGDYYGPAGGTGGTGIIVKGGDSYASGSAIGGVGLYVEGGTGVVGGTGIIVKGGTGSVGRAIETYGDVIIRNKSGEYLSTISSNADGANINGVQIKDSKVKAPNGFFQTSDERLKNIVEPISVDLAKLSKLRKVYFKWKDNSTPNNEIGMIAQDVQKIYPELVYEDGEHLSLAYDKLSVIALEAIDVLNEKNNELEKRINKLESIILK